MWGRAWHKVVLSVEVIIIIISLNLVFSLDMGLATFPELGHMAREPRKTNSVDTAWL